MASLFNFNNWSFIQYSLYHYTWCIQKTRHLFNIHCNIKLQICQVCSTIRHLFNIHCNIILQICQVCSTIRHLFNIHCNIILQICQVCSTIRHFKKSNPN